MVTPTNRDKIRINGNSESSTSVVDVCVGKAAVFDSWGARINAGHRQGYESALHMFWKLFQTLLPHHERINGQIYPFSSFMDNDTTFHRCNNGWSVRKLPIFTGQRWRMPEASIRIDTIEASTELDSRRSKKLNLDKITRLD